MNFKEFLNKVEKEYFIDGEDYEELWEDESGFKQLLNEDKMSIPERLVLEKVRAKKKSVLTNRHIDRYFYFE